MAVRAYLPPSPSSLDLRPPPGAPSTGQNQGGEAKEHSLRIPVGGARHIVRRKRSPLTNASQMH